MYQSPVMYPCNTSSTAALSRTLRVTTWRITRPAHASCSAGPSDTRPRVGFRPNSPHMLAGMRIEPPPSPAWPTGTIPLATAAAEPPLEPPLLCARFQGLCVGPYACGSAVGIRPNSGVLVLPTITNPARSSFSKR